MKINRSKSLRPIPPHARRVFRGKIFEVYQWKQKLYDGSFATFEKLKRTDGINVLPITDTGKIIIARQEQPGYPPFWGGIGGRLDPGEAPLAGAKRELREETGLEAQEFILWDAVKPSFMVEWTNYLYIAKGLRKIGRATPDVGEKIELRERSFDEFVALTRRPDYRDKEIALLIHRALGNPLAFTRLRKLFSPLKKGSAR